MPFVPVSSPGRALRELAGCVLCLHSPRPWTADDLESAIAGSVLNILVPDGWSHDDWDHVAHKWDQGFTVSFTAPEDDDSMDDIAMISNWVQALGHHHYDLCVGESDEQQCEADWEAAWANSAYQHLSGADVIVTTRDND